MKEIISNVKAANDEASFAKVEYTLAENIEINSEATMENTESENKLKTAVEDLAKEISEQLANIAASLVPQSSPYASDIPDETSVPDKPKGMWGGGSIKGLMNATEIVQEGGLLDKILFKDKVEDEPKRKKGITYTTEPAEGDSAIPAATAATAANEAIAKAAEPKSELEKRSDVPSTAATEEIEADRTAEIAVQTKLLEEIRDNTASSGANPGAEDQGAQAGGLFGGAGIGASIFGGIATTLRKLFNPKTLMKGMGKLLTKVALPAMIIGSIINGIMDGWKEYQESGDIGKALQKGFGGILDFLTFGLIDAESLESLGDMVGAAVFDAVENIKEVFSNVSDWITDVWKDLTGAIQKIEIPKISMTLPVIGEVSAGPWHPFESDTTSSAKAPPPQPRTLATPMTPQPNGASSVAGKSEENIVAKENRSTSAANNTVVSAPTTNISRTTNVQRKGPVRSTEPSSNRLLRFNSI